MPLLWTWQFPLHPLCSSQLSLNLVVVACVRAGSTKFSVGTDVASDSQVRTNVTWLGRVYLDTWAWESRHYPKCDNGNGKFTMHFKIKSLKIPHCSETYLRVACVLKIKSLLSRNLHTVIDRRIWQYTVKDAFTRSWFVSVVRDEAGRMRTSATVTCMPTWLNY